MTRVSVIIPVFNVERYLHRCVDSILNQSYKDLEVIIVDDGSPDNCPAICEEYARKDRRVKVIHKNNGGLSSARNSALDIATGEYVMFVDSDDYIHPDTICTTLELAEKEGAEIVQFETESKKNPSSISNYQLSIYDNRSIFLKRAQRIMLCAKLYKRSLWDGIRMPEGMVNEDDGTTWKLYYRSKKIVRINAPYYHYTKNPDGIIAHQKKEMSSDMITHYTERIRYFENVGDKDLTDYSRWCFCLPLAIALFKNRVRKEDRKTMVSHFKTNLPDVLKCTYVPRRYRMALWAFNLILPK